MPRLNYKFTLIVSILLFAFGYGFGFIAFPEMLRDMIKSVWPISFFLNFYFHFFEFYFNFISIERKKRRCIWGMIQRFGHFTRKRQFILISASTCSTWQINKMWLKEVCNLALNHHSFINKNAILFSQRNRNLKRSDRTSLSEIWIHFVL